MSSTYGDNLKLSIFGQSHGPAIGMTLDGIPAGLPVDPEILQEFLNRRAPGQNDWSTPRREADRPEFLSGILEGYTCGAPIAAIIPNKNTRSGDYANLKDCPRPGHADYTAQVKYGGFQDAAGGGHFSGRLTAPLCIAGGLCKQWLAQMGIQVAGRIASIGGECDDNTLLDPTNPQLDEIGKDFPVFSPAGENCPGPGRRRQRGRHRGMLYHRSSRRIGRAHVRRCGKPDRPDRLWNSCGEGSGLWRRVLCRLPAGQ